MIPPCPSLLSLRPQLFARRHKIVFPYLETNPYLCLKGSWWDFSEQNFWKGLPTRCVGIGRVKRLDSKSARKVLYNIDLAEQTNDTKRFKKLKGEIWEFRSTYLGNQFRLLAFWDKTDSTDTLVLATHGIVKKNRKVPKKEIDPDVSGEKIRQEYFANKNK